MLRFESGCRLQKIKKARIYRAFFIMDQNYEVVIIVRIFF